MWKNVGETIGMNQNGKKGEMETKDVCLGTACHNSVKERLFKQSI